MLSLLNLNLSARTFNMNTSETRVPGTTNNPQCQAVETRVETIDYRSSAGQGQEQRTVEVVHKKSHPAADSSTTTNSGGVLADAAATVASALQSAKDSITGK